MTEETTAKLAAVRERLSKATPGPYQVYRDADHENFMTYMSDGLDIIAPLIRDEIPWDEERTRPRAITRGHMPGGIELESDCEFFAHAWCDISSLLGIVKDLTRERDEHEAEVNQLLSDTLSALRIAENDVARLTAERDAAGAARQKEIVAWLRAKVDDADRKAKGSCVPLVREAYESIATVTRNALSGLEEAFPAKKEQSPCSA